MHSIQQACCHYCKLLVNIIWIYFWRSPATKMRATLFAISAAAAATVAIPNVPLQNSAVKGIVMPAIGLGTGGYQSTANGWGQYPECWNEGGGCGAWVVNATTQWLQLAQALNVSPIRVDNGNTYAGQ